MDVADLRKRIKKEIDGAKQDAEVRRGAGDEEQAGYGAFLAAVVLPLIKQAVVILRAEGLGFQTFTPADSARVVSERSPEDFIEFDLDTSTTPPRVVGRVSVKRGRRGVFVDEQPLAPGRRIGEISEDDVLEFLMRALRILISR